MARKQSNTEGSHTVPPYVPVPVELIEDLDVTAVEFRIWSYIRWRQGKNCSAYPSNERISKDLSLSKNTVKKSLRRLKEQGWLQIIPPDGTGRGHHHNYTVNLQVSASKKGSKIDPFTKRKGVKNCALKGSKIDPELIKLTKKGGSAFGEAAAQADAIQPSPYEIARAQMEHDRKKYLQEHHKPKEQKEVAEQPEKRRETVSQAG